MNQQKTSALLVMDFQTMIVGMLENPDQLLDNVNKAIKKARANGIPVFFIRVGFRSGAPEISPNNKPFMNYKKNYDVIGDKWKEIHPALNMSQNDVIINKRRVSAFTGSDLQVLLSGQQISHLVLAGIATSGVVLSTLREAADKDFVLTVLADCCADRDEEVHRILTNKIFPNQASVLQVDDWN